MSALVEAIRAVVCSSAKIGFLLDTARQHGHWSEAVQNTGISEVFAQLAVECFRAHQALMLKGMSQAQATAQLVVDGWANKLAPHFSMMVGGAL